MINVTLVTTVFPCADVANAMGWLTSVTWSLETVWTAGNTPLDPTVKGKRGFDIIFSVLHYNTLILTIKRIVHPKM